MVGSFELSVVCRSVPLSEIVPARRFVVLAVVNDPYVVDEYENVCFAVHVFVSPRSVDDAAPDSDVRNPASLLNQDSLTDDEATVFSCPPVPRYAKPCAGDVNRVLPLNVFVPLHVLLLVVPKAREILFDDICRGYVEDVILFRYAMFQSDDDAVSVLYELFQFVVLAVSGMLYPALTPNTPVEEL